MHYEIEIRGMTATLDTDTGAITGPGAGRLQALLASVLTDGYVLGPPYPTRYPVSDPARKPVELAAVLAAAGVPLPAGLDWTPMVSAIPSDAVA